VEQNRNSEKNAKSDQYSRKGGRYKKQSHIEDDIQKNIISVAKVLLNPSDGIIFAVPNGGRRSIGEAKKLKDMGVMSGVSDLILLLRDQSCTFIELKRPKTRSMGKTLREGTQSDQQLKFQEIVELFGFEYVVIRSIIEFQNFLVPRLLSLPPADSIKSARISSLT
jgi:hypothetical protein